MCRSKTLGGRRCPQHTDPIKHAAYNKRRRELYAAKRDIRLSGVVTTSIAGVENLFTPFNVAQGHIDVDDNSDPSSFKSISLALAHKINPDFSEELWDDEDDWDIDEFNENLTTQRALIYYTLFGYQNIRRALTNEPPRRLVLDNKQYATVEQRKWLNDAVEKIDNAISLAETPAEPRVLYRGMRVPAEIENDDVGSWIHKNFPVGGVISHKSYMSTSLNTGTAIENFSSAYERKGEPVRSVAMEFVSKQGAPLGAGLSNYGYQEAEVLMPRNARFKVLSVDENVPYHYETSWGVRRDRKKIVIRLIDVTDDESEEI